MQLLSAEVKTKELPLPFQGGMVRATLADLKRQTRRPVRAPAPPNATSAGAFFAPGKPHDGEWNWLSGDPRDADTWSWVGEPFRCPYGKPGDQLWVREAWRTQQEFDHLRPVDLPREARIAYEASQEPWPHEALGRLRQARFMCRWMSRIQLEITAVRVERLQDISEADAIAEGCHPAQMLRGEDDMAVADAMKSMEARERRLRTDWAVARYAVLWDSINGATVPWNSNPWVWAVEFRRIQP